MNRPGRRLWLAAWTLILACSGGRDEAPSAGSAGAPGGGESSTRGTVPMKIAASVGGKTYQASGPGECASSTEASIYAGGVLAVADTDDHGDKILMTVECERFDEVVAEGG